MNIRVVKVKRHRLLKEETTLCTSSFFRYTRVAHLFAKFLQNSFIFLFFRILLKGDQISSR